MDMYRNILLVINTLSNQNLSHIHHAINAMRPRKVNVHLAYIIPNIPAYYHQIPSMGSVENNIQAEAKQRLSKIGQFLEVEERRHWLIQGQLQASAKRLAKQINADLIVMENSKDKKTSKLPETLSRWFSATKVLDVPCIEAQATAHMLEPDATAALRG